MVFQDLHGILSYTDFLGIGKRLMDWINWEKRASMNVSGDSIKSKCKRMAKLVTRFFKSRECIEQNSSHNALQRSNTVSCEEGWMDAAFFSNTIPDPTST